MDSLDKTNNWVIYGIRLAEEGSLYRYIGYTTNYKNRVSTHTSCGSRGYSHKGSKTPLYDWMHSKNGEKFCFDILEVCDSNSGLTYIHDRETYWISHYRDLQGDLQNRKTSSYLLNVNDGGGGATGYTHTEETKLKISESMQGRTWSEESVEKLKSTLLAQGGTWKSRKFSEEHRANLSGALSGVSNPFYGKTHTDGAKEKLRIAALNRKKIKCLVCGRIVDIANAKRWHMDKCGTYQPSTYQKETLRGEKSGTAKLTEEDVRAIRARALTGEKKSAIVRDYAIGYTQLSRIIKRESWDHID